VIEDAEDNRDLLYYLLRDEFLVRSYGSGEDALQSFETDVPDLILLDIRLAGMDGLEVLSRIRQHEQLRALPVVAVTANAMAGDRFKYLTAGFDEYVSKPIIDVDAFLVLLRQLVSPRSD
jgi:CheY-like chemotaxis protein